MRAALFFALLLAACASGTAAAQSPVEGTVQLGAGLAPGLGLHAVARQPALTVLTREIILSGDYEPRVEGIGGRGRLLVSVGAGGSVRLVRVAELIQNREYPFDLDVGLRLGPSFFVSFYEESAASQAEAFRLFLEPFARGVITLAGRRVFAEVGTQAPVLRAGLVVEL